MYILGIACFGQHDSGIALLKDGSIVFASEEDKFSRIKHDNRFPYKSLNYCLNREGIRINDISHIGFYSNLEKIPLEGIKHIIKYFPKSLYFLKKGGNYLTHLSIEKVLRKELGYKNEIHYVKHHLCHAASTYLVSPFEDAAILTIDGTGEWTTTWFGKGEKNKITQLDEIKFPHSLGRLYEAVTQFLGFTPQDGEGKVMGLASYGKPTYSDIFQDIVKTLPDGKFCLNLKYFDFQYGKERRYSKEFIKVFGKPRLPEESIKIEHENLASSLQKRLEEVALYMAKHLYKITNSSNLCLAGGVALNSQMNSVLLQYSGFKNIFIQPASGDPGTALGVSKYIYHEILGNKERFNMDNAYLGASYSEDEIKKILDTKGLKYKKISSDKAKICASLIAKGDIVAWFQGRTEFGPRALGNRSILADPRREEMKDILNKKVKHREPFRPFAPSILEEKCRDYFEIDYPSPYMLLVYKVKKSQIKKIPAVTHIDGTSRVQTVSKDVSPLYYSLISEFEKITGIPIILNTSFNLKGEPIVSSPEDAIESFLKSSMDHLFIEDFWLSKNI